MVGIRKRIRQEKKNRLGKEFAVGSGILIPAGRDDLFRLSRMLNQIKLRFSGKLFNSGFHLERKPPFAHLSRKSQGQRPPASKVLGATLSALMFQHALFNVQGNPGVKAIVPTLDQVDRPICHDGKFDVIP